MSTFIIEALNGEAAEPTVGQAVIDITGDYAISLEIAPPTTTLPKNHFTDESSARLMVNGIEVAILTVPPSAFDLVTLVAPQPFTLSLTEGDTVALDVDSNLVWCPDSIATAKCTISLGGAV